MAFYSLNTSDVPTKFFMDEELESLKSVKLDDMPDLSTEEAILKQYEDKLPKPKKEPPPKPPKKNGSIGGREKAVIGAGELPIAVDPSDKKDEPNVVEVKEEGDKTTEANTDSPKNNEQDSGYTVNKVVEKATEGADKPVSDPNVAAVDTHEKATDGNEKTDGDEKEEAKEEVAANDRKEAVTEDRKEITANVGKETETVNKDPVAPTILPTNTAADANTNINTSVDIPPDDAARSMSGKYIHALAVVEQTEKDELMARLIDRDAKADIMSQRVKISKEEAVFYLESTDDLNLEAAIAIYESFKN